MFGLFYLLVLVDSDNEQFLPLVRELDWSTRMVNLRTERTLRNFRLLLIVATTIVLLLVATE